MHRYTNKDRARAALHEDRTNDYISQAEYEAQLAALNGASDADESAGVAWVIAILLILALAYVILRALS